MSFQLPPEREYLTAAEAAAEKLPGFEFKERNIQYLIKSGELQPWRMRTGRGGGREFCWTALPREARAEYLKRYGVASADDREADPVAKADKRELRADARKKIVDAAQDFIARRGTTIEAGLKSFCKAYAKRALTLPPWVYGVEKEALPDQVRRWKRIIEKKGVGFLIDRRGRKPKSGLLERDTLLHNFISARIGAIPHLTAARLFEMIALQPPHGLGRVIAKRTLQRHLAAFKKSHKQAVDTLNNPDRARSHYKPAFGSRSAHIERVNQLWEIDASPADVMCRLPNGAFIRMKLMAFIDVKARDSLVLVTDQPRARATMALTRRGIIEFGLPEEIKIDNGREFSNFAFERFCSDAPRPIRLNFSDAYTPEQKPHIERFFGTLHRQFSEIAHGYIGHNVADRQAIENRRTYADRFGRGEEAQLLFETAYTPEQLQARLNVWCREVYAQKPHEGLNGKRPVDVRLALQGDVLRVDDIRLLDALMLDAPDGHSIRVVGKRGIKLNNRIFGAPELGGILADARRVHVRFDPYDPDKLVVYNADRTQFICVAVAADALSNEERMRIAQGMVARHRSDAKDLRATVRRFNKVYAPEGTLDALLTEAANDPFPLDAESHAGMVAAASPSAKQIAQGQAMAALENHGKPEKPSEPTAAERADYDDRIAELEPKPEPEGVEHCDGYDRPKFVGDGWDFRFFDWALGWIASGERLDARDTQDFDTLRNDELFQRIRKQRQQEKGGAEEVA